MLSFQNTLVIKMIEKSLHIYSYIYCISPKMTGEKANELDDVILTEKKKE